MRFPYSLGDSPSTSPPSSAKRALIVGSARAALISRLSVSMISAGVLFGAPIPAHALVSKPGTKSPSMGTSGSPCQRIVAVTAKGRSPIRDMQHVDAGHHFEQLAGHVRDGTVARRSKTDLARMSLGVGDELGNRLGRK